LTERKTYISIYENSEYHFGGDGDLMVPVGLDGRNKLFRSGIGATYPTADVRGLDYLVRL